MEIKIENLKDIIEIYQLKNVWYVDFIGGFWKDDRLNVAVSEVSETEALKFALINLGIEYLKSMDIQLAIDELERLSNSNDLTKKYSEFEAPSQ